LKSRIKNWFKEHRTLRLLVPTLTLALILALAVIPAYAALEYLDVDGTYTVSARTGGTYLDGTRHPRVNFDIMTLDNAAGTTSAVTGTLSNFGEPLTLAGLVGAGSRPAIALTGTDSVGTNVVITGRVLKTRAGVVTGIGGKIQGYVTSDGQKGTHGGAADTSAHSVVASHSETYSALLTQGAAAGACYVRFNNPATRIRLDQLENLRAGLLGYWFNLQVGEGPGPQFELRFVDDDYVEGDTDGHVEITIMAYQAPYVGLGTWVELELLPTTISCIYCGNDPTDSTSFSMFEGGHALSEMEALINAEVAMTAGGDSCSRWTLQRVGIEMWEAGARTCYVDDVTISGLVYTLEPATFSGSFRARINE